MPENVTVDTLRLNIDLPNNNSAEQVDALTRSLKSLNNVLKKFDSSQLSSIANSIAKIGMSVGGLADSAKKVENLNKKIGTLEKSLNKVNNGGDKSSVGNKVSKGLKLSTVLGKLYFFRNYTKQIGQAIGDLTQRGINFTETLNMWQVSMKDNVATARTFITTMNQAYGVSEQVLMKYQGTFKNMLSAFGGLGEEMSYSLSKSLTNMALDFSSLFNTSIDDAMVKFQAVLSGQVRPIRSISGYDITENTIFSLYQELGGTKSMRQLNQLEKRLLRILAVFKQMETTNATGDLQKTLGNNANQLRIMSSIMEEIGTWIGNAVSYLIYGAGWLITINSYLIVARELAKSFAYSLGYREDNFSDGMLENLEGVNEELDKTQGKLLGFDKFNVLGDAAGSSDIDIGSELMNAFGNYDSILNGVVNPSVEKADELLKKLGYDMVYYVGLGEDTVRLTREEFEKLYGTIENANSQGLVVNQIRELSSNGANLTKSLALAGSAVGTFVAALSALSLLSKVNDAFSNLSKSVANGTISLSNLKKILSPIGILLTAIAAALTYMYSTNEDFRESVNRLLAVFGDLTVSALKPILTLLEALIEPLTAILDVVAQLLAPILELAAILLETAEAFHLMEGSTYAALIGLAGFFGAKGILALSKHLADMTKTLDLAAISIDKTRVKMMTWGTALPVIAAGVGILVSNISELMTSWDDMSSWERATRIISAAAAAIMIAASAIAIFHGAWTMGTAAVAIGAGIVAVTAAISAASEQAKRNADSLKVSSYASGGGFNTADLFYANENGKTELIASSNKGGGAVMNMKQLREAISEGMAEAMQGFNTAPYNSDVIMDGRIVGQMVSESSNIERLRVGYRR